jgi:hypothetical protein
MQGWSRTSGDQAASDEFREAYRRPGAKYFGIICIFGSASAFAYYSIDLISGAQPWFGGAQNLRLLLAGACLALGYPCWTRAALATRYYAPLFSVVSIVLVAIACFASYTRHRDHSFDQMLGALDRTLVLCIVVTFGFSRLSALSTAGIACSGAAITLIALWFHHDNNVARLSAVTFHLAS